MSSKRWYLILLAVSQVAACQATPPMILAPSAVPLTATPQKILVPGAVPLTVTPQMSPAPSAVLLTCERIRRLSTLNLEVTVTSSHSEFAQWLSASPEFSLAIERVRPVPNSKSIEYIIPGGGNLFAELSESGQKKVTLMPQSAIALDLRAVVECLGPPDYYLFYGTPVPSDKVGVGVNLFYLKNGWVIVGSKIPETVHIAHTADVNQILIVELIRVENGSLDAVFDSAFLAERDPYAKPKVFKFIKPWPGDLLKMDAVTDF